MANELCAYCGQPHGKSTGAINRAAAIGAPLYCNRTCYGLAHRKGKTPEQKKEEKRLYDLNYRATSPTLKARRSAYHKKTYDPVVAAEKRKERMPQHVEYCRRPEYKAWKREYDRQYLARKQYGDFGEAAIILSQIEKEIMERGEDRFQRAATNGTLNKKQTRRREYERLNCNKS